MLTGRFGCGGSDRRAHLRHWMRQLLAATAKTTTQEHPMTPLRQRMIDDMQLRNLAPATQRNYIHHVARFASYYGLSPEKLDLEDIRQYQLYLLNDRKYSPEAVNQSMSALKFVYTVTLEMPWSDEHFPRARRPHKLPVVLSQEEVVQFFDSVPSLRYRAALMPCYAPALPVSQPVAFQI